MKNIFCLIVVWAAFSYVLKVNAQPSWFWQPSPLGPYIDLDNWELQDGHGTTADISDNFYLDTQLDITKWDYIERCNPSACGVAPVCCNYNYAWSQCQNVAVQNGTGLIIKIDDCSSTLPCGSPCSSTNPYLGYYIYTTGGIQSKNTVSYGYLEISAKLPGWNDSGIPKGKGLYPTFWVYGGVGCTKDEIDILEPNGDQYANANFNEAGFHDENTDCWIITCVSCSGSHKVGRAQVTSSSPLFDGYHNYAVEFLSDRIIFYLDQKPFAWFVNPSYPSTNAADIIHALNMQPMLVPIYPTLDVNDAAYLSQIPFPQYMNVAYFHYWKLRCDCNTPVTIDQNSDIPFYLHAGNSYVKQTITFRNNISNVSLNATDNRTFRATDEIDILPGFTAPNGCTANFNITPPCDPSCH